MLVKNVPYAQETKQEKLGRNCCTDGNSRKESVGLLSTRIIPR